MDTETFILFLTEAFLNLKNLLKEGGAFYIWFATRHHMEFETALKNNDLEVRQELIWCKNTITLGRQDYQWKHEPCLYGWKGGASHYFIDDRTKNTLLEFNKPIRNDLHPTMKPLDLIGSLIKNSSKPGEVVADLFGGSGSTLIACEQLDRKCLIMELDPRYVDVIIKRWEDFTGKKVVLISEN